MPKRKQRLVKSLLVGTMFVAYQAPGCDLALNDAMLQSLLDNLQGLSDVSINIDFESGGHGSDDNSDSSHEDEEHDSDEV